METTDLTPIGSMFSRPEETVLGYQEIIIQLPKTIKTILGSTETESYVRGISRAYDILDDLQPHIPFAILEISIGKKVLAQLPAILSTELKLSNDKAQKMATEIEKDVFGPVRAELDEFLRKQKAQSGSMALRLPLVAQGKQQGRLQNVLNLKELPARPSQKDFPVRPPRPSDAPHPNPLPERERGSTTPKPQFPLPPLPRRSDSEGGSKPIRFT